MKRSADLESVLYDVLAHAKRVGLPENAIPPVRDRFEACAKLYSTIERAPASASLAAFEAWLVRRNEYAAAQALQYVSKASRRLGRGA